MKVASGYKILETLHKNKNSIIYRAQKDNKSYILKILNNNYPVPEQISKYYQEYEITNNYKYEEGIIKSYDFIKDKDKYIIVFEDFSAISLNLLLKKRKIVLKEFLEIAIKIIFALENIHKNNIIHKDINPSNIVINVETGILKIIDFGISGKQSFENPFPLSPDILEGTLSYISPEQTGRMNRTLDYRTDFYSLGLTLYELFTGKKLFKEKQPLKLVHSHIAREPVFSDEFMNNAPKVLINIIKKLISKTPEERYQSAWGIRYDFEKCLKNLSKKGEIREFDIAEADTPNKFYISKKLFGRENNIKKLFDNFEKVTNGDSEFLLISGYSGVGKTSLIQEIYRPILNNNSFFCKGKFEQFQRDIPYKAIKQAGAELVKQVLSKPKEELNFYKEKLLKSLGSNTQIIIELIPEISSIIEQKENLKEINPSELQNLILLTFSKFLQCFADNKTPLILFLDDLQWADSASLEIINNIFLTQKVKYFLFLGAYRHNEIDEKHPLKYIFNQKDLLIEENTIFLDNLSKEKLNLMISDTLKRDIKDTITFSDIIYQKTNGNPFFANELLKTFYEKGIIYFNFDKYYWDWEIAKVKKAEISQNVVEIILEKFRELSKETIELLKMTSCLGNNFDLKFLHLLTGNNFSRVLNPLKELIIDGILIPIGKSYRELNYNSQEYLIENSELFSFKFNHDKVQKAAYLLNRSDELPKMHLFIARSMIRFYDETEISKNIINIVEQFNKGKNFLKNDLEKIELAELNLKAGKKAILSGAYRPAMTYFYVGNELLPEYVWSENYQLSFDLKKLLAETAYICGQFDLAESSVKTLINKAKTELEKAEIYYLQTIQFTTLQKHEKAITIAIKGLKCLDIELKPNYEVNDVLEEAGKIPLNLKNRKIEDLVNEPEITDDKNKLICRLIQSVFLPSYSIKRNNLLAVSILKDVNECLKNGIVPETPYIYNAYALLLGHNFGDLKTGYEFGKVAYVLNEKFNDPKTKTVNMFTNTSFVQYWNNSHHECVKHYQKVIETGLETGDLIYTSYACTNITPWNYSLTLEQAISEGNKYMKLIKSFAFQDSIDVANIFQHLRLNMIGKTNNLFSFSSTDFDEEEMLKRLYKTQNFLVITLYYIYKIQPYYLYEDYQNALKYSIKAEETLEALYGQAHVTDFVLFSFLSITALYNNFEPEEKNNYLEKLNSKLSQVTQWADNNPENFEHFKLIMLGELSRLENDFLKADEYLQKAITHSDKYSFLQHKAIASELAGKLWLIANKENFAFEYLKNAVYYYELWGANQKVTQLNAKFTDLFLNKSKNTSISFDTTTKSDTQSLDSETIIKSSRLLLGEKRLDKLLKKMIHLIIENAGAEKCILVLPKNDKWYIEAECELNSHYQKILHSLPIDSKHEKLPMSIFNYVIQSLETVLMHDALNDDVFINDPYIIKFKPLSVLCMPLINHGKLDGVLYLENNLTKEAFTKKRLKILEILTVQASISLENSILYKELEQRVKKRTEELSRANTELKELNYEKNELLNIVTHNLKSPIGSIIGFTTLINNISQNNNKDITNYSQQIISESNRMLKMIGNFLDINTIESGNYKIYSEIIDLIPFVKDLLMNYYESVSRKNITLDYIYNSEQFLINADEAWLAQILDNIISNAIKFSPFDKNITIKIDPEKNNIQIIDQGPGFNEEDKKRLFQKFSRLSALPTGGETSTGLGLSIVKKMTEILKWNIHCESQVNQGTTFTITF